MNFNYYKVWKNKECALNNIRGAFEEFYDLLSMYYYQLETKKLKTITHIN